jgi:hypothetical protein
MQKEAVDLREANKAQKKEIGALGRAQAKSDKEMSEFRAQFAREQEAMKREIAVLGRQLGEEAAARGKFAQELGSLKTQFAEERTKWDEASKQSMREHESLQKQNPAPPPKPSHRRSFRSLRTNASREESQRPAMCARKVSSKSPRAALPAPVAPLGTPPTRDRFDFPLAKRAGWVDLLSLQRSEFHGNVCPVTPTWKQRLIRNKVSDI